MRISLETLEKSLPLDMISPGDPERECLGVYVGDLLSWVMSHASFGDVWVTIMSNSNVVAVADLVDVSCVILSEGVTLDEKDSALARDKGVCVYSCPLSSFEICSAISKLS